MKNVYLLRKVGFILMAMDVAASWTWQTFGAELHRSGLTGPKRRVWRACSHNEYSELRFLFNTFLHFYNSALILSFL